MLVLATKWTSWYWIFHFSYRTTDCHSIIMYQAPPPLFLYETPSLLSPPPKRVFHYLLSSKKERENNALLLTVTVTDWGAVCFEPWHVLSRVSRKIHLQCMPNLPQIHTLFYARRKDGFRVSYSFSVSVTNSLYQQKTKAQKSYNNLLHPSIHRCTKSCWNILLLRLKSQRLDYHSIPESILWIWIWILGISWYCTALSSSVLPTPSLLFLFQ